MIHNQGWLSRTNGKKIKHTQCMEGIFCDVDHSVSQWGRSLFAVVIESVCKGGLNLVISSNNYALFSTGWKVEDSDLAGIVRFILISWFLVVFGNKVTRILRNSLFIYNFHLACLALLSKKSKQTIT